MLYHDSLFIVSLVQRSSTMTSYGIFGVKANACVCVCAHASSISRFSFGGHHLIPRVSRLKRVHFTSPFILCRLSKPSMSSVDLTFFGDIQQSLEQEYNRKDVGDPFVQRYYCSSQLTSDAIVGNTRQSQGIRTHVSKACCYSRSYPFQSHWTW